MAVKNKFGGNIGYLGHMINSFANSPEVKKLIEENQKNKKEYNLNVNVQEREKSNRSIEMVKPLPVININFNIDNNTSRDTIDYIFNKIEGLYI